MNQRLHQRRHDIAHHADHANSADGREGKRKHIVTRQDWHGTATANFCGGFNTAGGLLDGDNIWMLGQTLHCLRQNCHAASARNGIQHNRQVGRVGDMHEMLVNALLIWLVVIRRDMQRGVRAQRRDQLVQLHRGGGVVASSAGHHLHTQ